MLRFWFAVAGSRSELWISYLETYSRLPDYAADLGRVYLDYPIPISSSIVHYAHAFLSIQLVSTSFQSIATFLAYTTSW